MAVAATIKCQSFTTGAITSNTSQQWGVKFRVEHTGAGTTNMVDVEINIGVQHYWLSADFGTSNGITVDIDNSGQTFGTTTGTLGTCVATWVRHDDLTNKPIIYPNGQNKRLNAVLKLRFPTSTLSFSGTGSGIQDIQIRIRDKAYRNVKYFNFGSVKTDIEDSYSYRDNAGANETVYADNSKVWIKDLSANVVRWGTEPNYDEYPLMIIDAENFSTIDQNAPTVSDETLTVALINKGTGTSAKRGVFRGLGSTVANLNAVLKAEALFMNVAAPYFNSDSIELRDLTALPDLTPTWNEVNPNLGSSLLTQTMDQQYTLSTWLFSNAALNTLIQSWLTNWNTNHKGLVVKFTTENSGGNGEQSLSSDNNLTETTKPRIFVAYTVNAATKRRIFFS